MTLRSSPTPASVGYFALLGCGTRAATRSMKPCAAVMGICPLPRDNTKACHTPVPLHIAGILSQVVLDAGKFPPVHWFLMDANYPCLVVPMLPCIPRSRETTEHGPWRSGVTSGVRSGHSCERFFQRSSLADIRDSDPLKLSMMRTHHGCAGVRVDLPSNRGLEVPVLIHCIASNSGMQHFRKAFKEGGWGDDSRVVLNHAINETTAWNVIIPGL